MVYNWALAMKKEAYEKDGSNLLIGYDIKPKIKFLKKEKQFLKEVDSVCLDKEVEFLGAAYEKFFKYGAGFPKFKHKENKGSYTTHLVKGAIRTNENVVLLPKIGFVKCIFHREIKGIVKDKPYVTISRTTTGEFYISIKASCVVQDKPESVANIDNTIGVDLGMKDLAILDDGTKFDKVEVDKKLERKKKRMQRKLSKKVGSKKGQHKSNNYMKLQRKISKIDQKISRRREQYQYEVVSDIIERKCDYIGIEDLNVKGMSSTGRRKKNEKLSQDEYNALSDEEKKKYSRKKKRGFNRNVLNNGMYSFKMKLEQKAVESGKEVVTVGRFYPSSQTCSNCGEKNKVTKNLSVREWTCEKCGTVHDRDVNAAKNIRNEAIRIKNECESTHKNLPRCNRDVKSVEIHKNEKPKMVEVHRVVESEIQTVFVDEPIENAVIT